jgi:hypothetical protein
LLRQTTVQSLALPRIRGLKTITHLGFTIL